MICTIRNTTIGILAAVLTPGLALGDAAAPTTYAVTQDAGNVTVCLENSRGRVCPDDGLLRRDTQSGVMVSLTACNPDHCFVDECVPAGTYQYGLATPYVCEPASMTTDFYVEVPVAGADPGCVPAVLPLATSVPWSTSRYVCEYHPDRGGCGTSGAVLGLNALVLAAGALLWRRRARRG
jgi:hypothetical protein